MDIFSEPFRVEATHEFYGYQYHCLDCDVRWRHNTRESYCWFCFKEHDLK